MFGIRIDEPPASAMSHSPLRIDWQARCTATSDDEHAVETDSAGPRRSKLCATRVARWSLSLDSDRLTMSKLAPWPITIIGS